MKIKKPTLVDDAKRCWRWLSVQAMAVAGAIQGAWLVMPDDLKSRIPEGLVQWVSLALLVLGIAGRVVKQGDQS